MLQSESAFTVPPLPTHFSSLIPFLKYKTYISTYYEKLLRIIAILLESRSSYGVGATPRSLLEGGRPIFRFCGPNLHLETLSVGLNPQEDRTLTHKCAVSSHPQTKSIYVHFHTHHLPTIMNGLFSSNYLAPRTYLPTIFRPSFTAIRGGGRNGRAVNVMNNDFRHHMCSNCYKM